ncbi:DUF1127 domain-containing protein [Amaricoccus sp.]|uniref:DUF1127 domain-containing protein n=1 Tax=Amaricoccus sp. TaxID=1872485 RepID=UPI001B62040F|nr:DUF1127 domain-containing protein [Amaricoccus sp.]MBP7003069.1 DUF1127 domain-containing protein [Amaricoccus sp.]
MTQIVSLDFRAGAARADAGFLARVRKGLADYRLYRATLDELIQLSDRDLADLGINRGNLREIAREAVYGA